MRPKMMKFKWAPELLWPLRPLIKHIAMIDDIDHIYVFIKSFVVVRKVLRRWTFTLKVFPSSSYIVIALKAVDIYLKGISVIVLYHYRCMR